MRGKSRLAGVAPAPMAALRFRSATELLLPSQWTHRSSRSFWFQMVMKSAVPIELSLLMSKSNTRVL